MTATPNATDYLKYAAAIVRYRIEWTADEIGGAQCGGDHDISLDGLCDLIGDVRAIADRFGDPDHYSDGRQVKTVQEIEPGVFTEIVWHPITSEDKPRSWRGTLRHDPDENCPGVYEVSTDPATQEILVSVVRAL